MAERVHRTTINDRELWDEATRAARSAFLNLSEGPPNEGVALRREYFTNANDRLHELLGAMDLTAAIGALHPDDAAAVQSLGARLKQMIRAPMH